MSSVKSLSLSQLRGLSADEVARLKAQGIKTSAELLAATTTSSAEHALAKKAGLTDAEVHEAHNRADLVRVAGLGGATADLFENAGVNSVKELAHRNAASLEATLQAYASAHPDSHEHVPGLKTVAQLINGAKALVIPPVNVTSDQAKPIAADALNRYIDDVLFNPNDPAGAAFRSAVLDSHPQIEQDAIRAEMHADVPAFLGDAAATSNSSSDGVVDQGDRWTFVGTLYGLHTEVDVAKNGQPGNILVEID